MIGMEDILRHMSLYLGDSHATKTHKHIMLWFKAVLYEVVSFVSVFSCLAFVLR